MNRWTKIGWLAVLILLAGCTSMSITTDYDHDVDFAGYKTFAWISKPRPAAPGRGFINPLMEERIKKAVENDLSAKGYSKDIDGQPHFLIAIHAGAKDRLNVTDYGYHYGPRGRWGHRHVEVNRYKEGTLILDFVDPRQKQLIWRGYAVGALANPEQVEEQIIRSVGKMLESFPPE
jgi:hypothetical protein